jgi:hypothetical protein
VAQQQPGLSQQLNQIAGNPSPAVGTMVNQQMAPQGATGSAPLPAVMGMNQQVGPNPQDLYNQYSSAVFGNPAGTVYGGAFGPTGDPNLKIGDTIPGGEVDPGFNPGGITSLKDLQTQFGSGGEFNPNPGADFDYEAYLSGDGFGGISNGQPGSFSPISRRENAQNKYFENTIGYRINPDGSDRLPDGTSYYDAWKKANPGKDVFTIGEDFKRLTPQEQYAYLNPNFQSTQQPAPAAQPAPAPIAQPAPAPTPAPVTQPALSLRQPVDSRPTVSKPVAQPAAQPKPAPMPTRATQGYTSRLPARPTTPVPVKPAAKPVAKAPAPKPVAKPVVKAAPKPVAKPNPFKPATKAPVPTTKR